MALVRIREARPLENYRVQLTLTDGRVIERDVKGMLVGPVFDGSRTNEDRFSEMRVEGGTLVWPNGADLCPDVLIWGALPAGRFAHRTGAAEYRSVQSQCRYVCASLRCMVVL